MQKETINTAKTRAEFEVKLAERHSELTPEAVKQTIIRLTPYLECPKNQKKPVPSISCFFCELRQLDLESNEYLCKGSE
jgi:hypothetical protein